MSLESLNRKLDAIPKAVREAVLKALEASANELAATMRALVPEDEGDLKRSIRVERGAHELQLLVKAGGPATTKPVREGVSATYDYALGVEYGTVDAEARPYFYPAIRLRKKRIRRRIRSAIRRAIRKEWQR